jgi:hypothetical protein
VAFAVLKFPAGALTALAALIAIGANSCPALQHWTRSHRFWRTPCCLLFGYAQQPLTGLIDKGALSLLSNVPGTDPVQDRPPSHAGTYS